MTEELLRDIRNLLIADRAGAVRKQVSDNDPPEDIEETGYTFNDGTKERRLKWPAALRIAVNEHRINSEIIAELLNR